MNTKEFATKEGKEWIRGLLFEREVFVTFTKKDGSERVMKCTLSENFIPQAENSSDTAKNRKTSDEALPVYDLQAEGWRSFRWDSVKQINFSLGE